MAEQNKIDEEIAKAIPCEKVCVHYSECYPMVNPVSCTKLEMWQDIKDFVSPLIEKAKEEEREWIHNELSKFYRQFDANGNATDDDSKVADKLYMITETRWQALNKEKE